jgi:kynurenine formamidase
MIMEGYQLCAADQLYRIDQRAVTLDGAPPTVSPAQQQQFSLAALSLHSMFMTASRWSWDAPFAYTAEKYRQTGNAALIWEGHKASREIGYCHLEKLHNLESLPADGFTVVCFPVKIRAASAGWTRAVAIVEDGK